MSFLIKEVIAWIARGVRLRKRLAEDIKMLVDNFSNHYPQLEPLKRGVSADDPSLSFIWDSTTDPVGILSESSEHLKALEASQCARFYDELSRIDEIRKEYNNSIRGIVTRPEEREGFLSLAEGCVEDLQGTYKELIKRGCMCLLELRKNHWFLDIDESHYQELRNRYSK